MVVKVQDNYWQNEPIRETLFGEHGPLSLKGDIYSLVLLRIQDEK